MVLTADLLLLVACLFLHLPMQAQEERQQPLPLGEGKLTTVLTFTLMVLRVLQAGLVQQEVKA
jgi:hypothetical protein